MKIDKKVTLGVAFFIFCLCFVSIFSAMIWQYMTLTSVHHFIEQKYPNVSHIDIATVLDKNDVMYFDVREIGEYDVSHINDAIHVSPSISNKEFVHAYKHLLNNKTLIFYCSVGRRSSELIRRLQHELNFLGVWDIYNLEGGIFLWHNEGMEVENNNGTTDLIHPYNTVWGRLINDRNKITYGHTP